MNTERYRFKVGAFQCIAINDAIEASPITDLTESVPQEQLAQAAACAAIQVAHLSGAR